ncbi:MAG: hypothetical protein IMX00_10235 [Limnochordales bacterium]|nr:hypothetical protein [Limnochordales bacterium]
MRYRARAFVAVLMALMLGAAVAVQAGDPAVAGASGQVESLSLTTGSSPDHGQGQSPAAERTSARTSIPGGLIIDPETALENEPGSETGLSLDQLGQAIGRIRLPADRARLRFSFTSSSSELPAWVPPALQLEIPKIDQMPASAEAEETFTILRWGTAQILLGDGSEGKWVAAEQRFQLNSSWEARARLFSPVYSLMGTGGARLGEGLRLELTARSQALSVEASLPVWDEPSLQAEVAYELGKGARVNAAYRVDADGISIRSSTAVGVALSLGENASLSASYRLIKWSDDRNEESSTQTPAREAEASLQFRF